MATTIEYARKVVHEQKKVGQQKWQRIILLSVLGYEALGCLLGGSFLIAEPDGRLMDMPVEIMNGVFPDFLIPGIILFGLGILNAAAFIAVFRNMRYNWIMAGIALGGLAIWFWVEITILQRLHWLHFMWGLPVVAGGLVAIPLVPQKPAIVRTVMLACGILSSVLYIAMNILVAMQLGGYNSADQTISELSAIGTPTRPLWVSLGILYTLLIAAFGWGIWQSAAQKRPLRIAGGLMIIYGVVGLAWPIFPMHQREILAAGGETLSDTMHLVMGVVSSLFMITAIGFGAAAFGKLFRAYSIATILILLLFGILTGQDTPNVQANLPTPWLGVWERIMIGVFIIWVMVFAIVLLRKKSGNLSKNLIEIR